MTAFGSIHTAVEAMKIGAFDYVQKPFEIEEMELKIEKAIEHRRLKHEIEYLRHTQQDIYDFDRIVGASGALQSVLAIVKKVAKSNTTVLIRGETGTGKELIAGAIHHNSLRAEPQLRQGQLRRAAGEPARVGAVRPREGRVHRRRQAAHRPLRAGRRRHAVPRRSRRHEPEHAGEDPARAPGARVRAPRRHPDAARRRARHRRDQPQPAADGGSNGMFREDLYYRLNVVSIDMPPLRDRKDDIRAAGEFFLKRFAGELKKRIDGLSPDAHEAADALQLARQHPRARERRSSARCCWPKDRCSPASICGSASCSTTQPSGDASPVVKIPPTGIPLEEIERQAVVEALKMSNWVQKDAAELLGISPRVMNYKIKMLGIELRARPAADGRTDRVAICSMRTLKDRNSA